MLQGGLAFVMILIGVPTAYAEPPASPVILKIDEIRLTKAQLEKQFQAMAHMPKPPKWEEIPPDIQANVLRGITHQYLLGQQAEAHVPDDDPRLKTRLAELKQQVRIQLYTEDMMKERIDKQAIEKEYSLRAGKHVSQKAMHLEQLFTRYGWKARQAKKALASGKDFELVKSMLNMKLVDMGEVVEEDLIYPQVQEVVMPLKPGNHTEPVETPFGWHIFQSKAQGAASIPPAELMVSKIQEDLWKQTWNSHLQTLIKQADITYYDLKGKKQKLPW